MAGDNALPQGASRPEALKRLDRLVGTWSMKGHLVGSTEENVIGRTTFRWVAGGFFLEQDVEIDFAGKMKIESVEIIGYDPETGAFSSYVYSNFSPEPLPYKWDLRGDTLTISVSYGPLDAAFRGTFSEDGESFSGGWRPNPGADETVNVPYDIGGVRIK